jgi:hypothetical protein
MMTTLKWSETTNGYRSGGYRLTRAGARRWSMECDASMQPGAGNRRSDEPWVFDSLRSARAAAIHLEVVRVRRIKLIRHATLAIAMFGLSIVFYLTMSAGTEATRLEWFTIAGIALVMSLSESLDAFVLVVADGWDHLYEVPRLTLIDTVVAGVVVATLWPRRQATGPTGDVSKIRTLT